MSTNAQRVTKHRRKLRRVGAKRIEVTVPADDAPLIRAAASTLRTGGAESRRLRQALRPLVRRRRARTGDELLAFFRASPLVGRVPEARRDAGPGRVADLS